MKNEHEINFNELLVDKENSLVSYNDKLHKYWIKGTKQACISVTTLIHKFTTFDEEFWSSYKALERILDEDEFKQIKPELLSTKKLNPDLLDRIGIEKELFNETRDEILAEWAEKREISCIRGTKIHEQHELGHLDGITPEIQQLGLGGSFKPRVDNNIVLGEQGVYPELLLSYVSEDNKLRLAGQADLVIVDGDSVYILDYKGLPLDTPILTTTGFKKLADLTKKDIIFDRDGNETNINNISEIHNNPCYKITFDNGEEIVADHEHK